MATETDWMKPDPDDRYPSVDLRTDVPHSARMYDYYIGGKNNFPADRAAADEVARRAPFIATTARANRRFLREAVRTLAEEYGVRQFLDIGTGLPTSPNTHEIAQSVDPTACVVYADNDPMVLAHARALLESAPQGRTTYLDADLRRPRSVLDAPQLAETLDLARPVALMLVAIMHFMPDEFDPYEVAATLVDALPSGSFLVLTHVTPDFAPREWAQAVETYRAAGIPAQVRSRAEVERFFDGMELLDPGVQLASRWWPDPTEEKLTDAEVSVYAAIARKP